MANDSKQDKAPETEGADKQSEKLTKRIVVLETENGALKRAVAELGAEVKELGSEVKELRRAFEVGFAEVEELITKPSTVAPAAPTSNAKGKKGEVPPGYFRNARGLLVEEQFRGTKQYELGETAFVNGVLRQAGEKITVTDEQPGSTWKPLVAKAVEQLVAGAPIGQQKRAADQER